MSDRICTRRACAAPVLPDELWLYVFSFLDRVDVVRAGAVCRCFYRISHDARLWRDRRWRLRSTCTSLEFADFVARRATPLRHLCLTDCRALVEKRRERAATKARFDGAVRQLGRQASLLRCIEVAFSRGLQDSVIAAFAEHCPQLERVLLRGSTGLTDAALDALARLPRLRVLDITSCARVTTAGLARLLAARRASLAELYMARCKRVAGTIFAAARAHLARSCGEAGARLVALRFVNLSLNRRITNASIAVLIELAPHLVRVLAFCCEGLDCTGLEAWPVDTASASVAV